MAQLNLNTQIPRKKTRGVQVGDVTVGNLHPISVQTMTNTPTHNVQATVQQIESIQLAGADIVRVSCPDIDSTQALAKIIKSVSIPVVADIHFHYKRAIEAAQSGAVCLRINPGNIGSKQRVHEVIKAAKDYNCSIRIGVNGGSLDKNVAMRYEKVSPQALLESAQIHMSILQDLDFHNFKVSLKASNVTVSQQAYQLFSSLYDYPLHLGVTEAGSLLVGAVKSSMAMGSLLQQGIGDTLRVSLSAPPEQEVKVGWEVLKALNIRQRGVSVISCPSCARQQFDVLAVVKGVEEKLQHIVNPISISIIGCVVNGPGEAKNSLIGITGGGNNKHQIYINGLRAHILSTQNIIEHICQLVETQQTQQTQQTTIPV